MRNLERRLTALEGVGGDKALAHLTDEELRDELIRVVEQIVDHGVPVPDE